MGFALHYNNCYHGIHCSYARHQSSAFYSFACRSSSRPIPWHQTCQGVQELYAAAIRSGLRQHEMIWTRSSVSYGVYFARGGKGWGSLGGQFAQKLRWEKCDNCSKGGSCTTHGNPSKWWHRKQNYIMWLEAQACMCMWCALSHSYPNLSPNPNPTWTVVPTQTLP